jgi:DNA polymerase-3 subunit delta
MHVFDYLENPPPASAVVAFFGDEPFLKRLAIARLVRSVFGDDVPPYAQFEGPDAQWRDVSDELRTRSLFSGDQQRLALVNSADEFISLHRSQLEDYLRDEPSHGILLLDVTKWAANTRLYKALANQQLQIECRAPTSSRGKQKIVDTDRVARWLVDWAKSTHKTRLNKKAASLLIEMLGVEFGLLDQELAKLALYTDPQGTVTESLVRQVTGGWQAKTAWELIDATVSGNAADALQQLHRLLNAGQHPAALFGAISWSLRRYAAATRVYQRCERQGRRISLAAALQAAGFQSWQRQEITKAERQLRRLGRARAAHLYRWLLEADLALKGSHSSPEMSRWVMERLLMRMACPTA